MDIDDTIKEQKINRAFHIRELGRVFCRRCHMPLAGQKKPMDAGDWDEICFERYCVRCTNSICWQEK